MILFANGCSMTIGEELGGEIIDNSGMKLKDLDPEFKSKNSWPSKLANGLNMQVVNKAKSGGSNDRILRTTFEWTSNYLNNGNNSKDLFVIIGWSAPARIEYRIKNQWVDISPQWIPQSKHHDDMKNMHIKYIMDDLREYTRTVLSILSLQSWLKANEIPYIFFNALCIIYDIKSTEISNMLNRTDKKRYYRFEDQNFCMHYACEKYPKGPRGHPLEEGHHVWAKILEDHITKNNLLVLSENEMV